MRHRGKTFVEFPLVSFLFMCVCMSFCLRLWTLFLLFMSGFFSRMLSPLFLFLLFSYFDSPLLPLFRPHISFSPPLVSLRTSSDTAFRSSGESMQRERRRKARE